MNALDRALIKRLDLVASLNDDDREALRALPLIPKTVQAGSDIASHGEEIRHCCLLLEGLTHRYRTMRGGKRQIIAFHVAGDIPDLHSLKFNTLDHSLAATVRCEIGLIPHDAIWNLCMDRPNIASALWRETLIDGAIFRQWIVSLGRMSGMQRTAHLLCELMMRMQAMGLVDGRRYHLPLTQNELADALGLTVVTVNRTLQTLKQKELIDRDRSWLTIKDWEGLAEIAEFDPGYLHFRTQPTMGQIFGESRDGPVTEAAQ